MQADWLNSFKNLPELTSAETLIIGQGLAGSCLALQMLAAKKPFIVMDLPKMSQSSRVAAGILNPLVFRYLTLSWRATEYLPDAISFYRKAEQLLGVRLVYPSPLLRLLPLAEKNIYLEKQLRPGLEKYLRPVIMSNLTENEGFIPGEAIQVHHTAWVDIKTLVEKTSQMLADKSLLIQDSFDIQRMQPLELGFQHNEKQYDRIIFCDGALARKNPFFDFVPFRPVKGELLIVKIPGLKLKQILNAGVFLLPLGEDKFKLGATYDWDDLSETPTNSARDVLLLGLRKLVHLPFEVLNHQVGIRPAVADRRPVVGVHPSIPNVWIMNGLGAKGAIMAPSLSKYLLERIFNNIPADYDVEPSRFIVPARRTSGSN